MIPALDQGAINRMAAHVERAHGAGVFGGVSLAGPGAWGEPMGHRAIATNEQLAAAIKRSAVDKPATSIFPGKPVKEEPAPPAPAECVIYTNAGVRHVEVDYFGFSPTHAIGYVRDPDGEDDRLVLALRAADIREIKLVEPCGIKLQDL